MPRTSMQNGTIVSRDPAVGQLEDGDVPIDEAGIDLE